MEALFIVPAMVSPQVNEKMIPALAKMIERNIILNNSSLFKKAALAKYNRFTTWNKVSNEHVTPVTIISDGIISENSTAFHQIGNIILSEQDEEKQKGKNPLPAKRDLSKYKRYYDEKKKKEEEELKKKQQQQRQNQKQEQEVKPKSSKLNPKDELDLQIKQYEFDKQRAKDKKATSADFKTYRDSGSVKQDEIETPSGIQFFRQVSLEPTILSIPIQTGSEEGLIIRVGVKCIPYIIDDVTSILNLLNEAKNMNLIERFFKNSIRKLNTKIWFTKRRAISKGDYIDPNEATEAIMYSPNQAELSNHRTLARRFTHKASAPWTTMIILSSYDIENNEDLMNLIINYRKLTKYVFGDIIITNETKESAYFCTPRLNNCQDIPYVYLKKVLNLSDVLDYSEASRTSAWRKESQAKDSGVKQALNDNTNILHVQNKIKDILL